MKFRIFYKDFDRELSLVQFAVYYDNSFKFELLYNFTGTIFPDMKTAENVIQEHSRKTGRNPKDYIIREID